MIDPKRKAFRDEDFNSDPRANAKDQVDMDNDDRDGRGIPTSFVITTTNDTTTADDTAGNDAPSNLTNDADVASGE